MKKWQITLLLIATLAAAGYWFTAMPAHVLPNGADSLARFVPGSYPVITESFKAVDESRPTAANNDYPGSPVRVLKGKIWRPAGLAQPGPLLVYSHGFMSFHQEGAYLTRFLASHGYTVVAVDYPLTNFFAPGKPLITDVVNQPGDVKFLIDTVLTRSQDNNDVLHNTIDPQRIAVAGVSLGGLTSTLAAFHRQVNDPRITAAISIAGPGSMLTPAFFAGSTVPFLMIYGDSDAIIPYDKNAAAIPQKYPGSILVTLKNASHAGFAAPAATFMRFMKNPDDIGCSQVRKGLKNGPANPEANFMASLSGEAFGLDMSDKSQPCTTPLIPVTMQAARQHMLTTLAAHAFLEKTFAQEVTTRDTASHYLLTTFAAENATEVSVTR